MIYIILRKVRNLTADVMQAELIGSSFVRGSLAGKWSLKGASAIEGEVRG